MTALEGDIASGDHLLVSYGTNSQTFVASGAVAGGATSIPITAASCDRRLPGGSVVTDTTGARLGREHQLLRRQDDNRCDGRPTAGTA